MPSYMTLILASGAWIWLLFAFAFGACAGSLINVLVYRLPLGLSVVSPPSKCPACNTKLTWRENIPVFGWLRLGGRCRFCRSKISPEYPLVEALVGFLFAGLFFLWYALPSHAVWLGVDWAAIRPEWADYDASFDKWPRQTWPMFIVLVSLVASLVAMSLVDLKTYTIPLQIPWFATVVALVFHVGYAAYLSFRGVSLRWLSLNAPFDWSLPTPRSWWWVGATLGGMIGLGLANIFLHMGWLRRSFADYAEWEQKHLGQPLAARPDEPTSAESVAATPPTAESPVDPNRSGFPWFRRLARFVAVFLATVAVLSVVGSIVAANFGWPRWSGLAVGAVAGPILAAFAIRVPRSAKSVESGEPEGVPADMWIQYPHARREMVKEILFLTPCIAIGWLGGEIASNLGGTAILPLWVAVLAGVLMGYLIGGGVVWLFRIVGSLGFAKEALGLGDVHLMAAVGACVGWIDAALAFPLAAVVGLYWVVIHAISTRHMPRAMQFGPYLAMATMLVILGKPLIEMGLTHLLAIQPPTPPVNLP
jgi:prepilin signal peptidase PulO-like enzyme (type II secretory pathway)